MSASWQQVMRPDLLEVEGYSHASARRGLLRLHANESPLDPRGRTDGLNRYPAPGGDPSLTLAMASYYGCDAQQVLPVRGSDDAIDLLVRSFCRAGQDAILICPPTFGTYAAAARLQNAGIVRIPLSSEDFAPDFDAIRRAADGSVRLVLLCSPNNPTGSVLDPGRVRALADELRGRALVVVDEAYVELADSPGTSSMVGENDNLTVLRTLSKAFGLAGIRCGALLGPADLLARLRLLMPPYPLSLHTVATARHQLRPAALDRMSRRIDAARRERARLAQRLSVHPEIDRVWPSQANFLLVQPRRGSARFVDRCRSAGVLVRRFDEPAVELDAVRITVGRRAENDRLLAALDDLGSWHRQERGE